LDYFEQALPLIRAVGDRSGEATTLNNIADIHFEQGELEKAADTFRQLITIDQSIGNVQSETLHRANLAWTLKQMGKTEEAMQELERAIAILRRYNLPYDAGGVSVERYEALLAQWR